ncbi:unnamed protein product [Rhodiola kirilowii]
MKCFYFSIGDEDAGEGVVSRAVSKVSWARSLSIASASSSAARAEIESESRELSEAVAFHEFLSRRRAHDLRVFRFSELKSATRGFTRSLLIGEGGFGCVYRGAVRVSDVGDGRGLKMDVAVKQLNRNGLQGHKEWINEVNLLGVVKHPNLVKLVGYCAEDDERGIQRLLVYELMENKSLEDHLLARGLSPLSWIVRLSIVRDAARGLAYLHEEMEFQLIFRDFKTSNILLDEHFNARLSDFGLARQGPAEGNNHVSTSVVGTIGYTAPEYVQTGRLTTKSDVWSFGVVLYELITGRRAVERNLPRGEQKLLEWVRPYISDSKKFHLIIDPRLEQLEQYTESAQKLSSLANKCLMKNPKSRPKMSEVVEALGDIISEIQPREEDAPQSANNINEDVESKHASKNMKRVFNFREMASLRNKSTRKLDWRNWTTGITKAI